MPEAGQSGMVTEPVALDADELGDRIRKLREGRGLSLRRLAQLADLSPSFVSQLERGLTSASIDSLVRITGVLGVSMGDLFSDSGPVSAPLRKGDRPLLPNDGNYREFILTRRPLANFEVYVGELPAGGSDSDVRYMHGDAQEFLLVISGKVCVYVDEERHEMTAGDSIEYLTSVPHRVANESDRRAEVLWVIGPPTVGRSLEGGGSSGGAAQE